MATIEIDDETSARLLFAARIAGTSVGEVVRVLVEGLLSDGAAVRTTAAHDSLQMTPAVDGPPEGGTFSMSVSRPLLRPPVPIYSDYRGVRVEAEYRPGDRSVRIKTGELAGTIYTSLTAAAVAVVGSLNPRRERTETNGRIFWRLTENGEPIRSILGKR